MRFRPEMIPNPAVQTPTKPIGFGKTTVLVSAELTQEPDQVPHPAHPSPESGINPIGKPQSEVNRIQTALVLSLLGAATLRADPPSSALKVGDSIPDVTLRSDQNKEIRLRETVAEKPSILIFYRGGWCPFCTRHLQSLATIQGDLAASGAQLLAISMDTPAKLKATPDREKLPYQLLSDSSADAAKAFGIAFKVDESTLKTYKNYGIDLESASGQTHHLLPHPAVFVVDRSGTIRFSHVNTDYKARLDPSKILEALKSAE